MPRAPKQCAAPDCDERVTGKSYCPKHAALNRNQSTWGRGSTRQSRKERELVLQQWPTCYLGYDGCTTISTEDDHVTPKCEGGTDDPSNRRGACHHCHKIKSQREASQARARKRPN